MVVLFLLDKSRLSLVLGLSVGLNLADFLIRLVLTQFLLSLFLNKVVIFRVAQNGPVHQLTFRVLSDQHERVGFLEVSVEARVRVYVLFWNELVNLLFHLRVVWPYTWPHRLQFVKSVCRDFRRALFIHFTRLLRFKSLKVRGRCSEVQWGHYFALVLFQLKIFLYSWSEIRRESRLLLVGWLVSPTGIFSF